METRSSGNSYPHPYVLLNHKDTLDSMFTLAHEMGHALHSYHSTKYQPTCTADYVIFVAEVASTCKRDPADAASARKDGG